MKSRNSKGTNPKNLALLMLKFFYEQNGKTREGMLGYLRQTHGISYSNTSLSQKNTHPNRAFKFLQKIGAIEYDKPTAQFIVKDFTAKKIFQDMIHGWDAYAETVSKPENVELSGKPEKPEQTPNPDKKLWTIMMQVEASQDDLVQIYSLFSKRVIVKSYSAE